MKIAKRNEKITIASRRHRIGASGIGYQLRRFGDSRVFA
jgi:hypothetical protein